MRFEGKVVAITGAASGIGRAIAIRLAREGASISALDVSAEGLSSLAAELEGMGRRCVVTVGSVGEEGNAELFIDRAVRDLGGLSGLVNNAGVSGPMQRFDTVRSEDFDRMIGINLKPVWHAMKLAFPHMRSAGGGAIVNVSSMAGIVPNRHHALYGMTKAAMISLTHHAAMDYAEYGIRVNALCPGPVETPIFDQMRNSLSDQDYAAAIRGVMRRTLLNRFGTADEQAAACAFLLSEEASFITGIALPVDGGWSISDGQTRTTHPG
jgi:NAD(P)-dependent dehydrogenase (short-subunit alcohol dehydrogenase family)